MKKFASRSLVFFFLIIIYHNKITSQNHDPNGMSIHSDSKAPAVENATHEMELRPTSCSSGIRDLNELNQAPPIADAYPFLSSDGLRIYFSRGGGSLNTIYSASRSSTNDPFGPSQSLGNIPAGAFSCWLSNDELEIFYTGFMVLNYSTRTSLASAFATNTTVTLNGLFNGFFAGPSLTPDKMEMYLFSVTPTGTLTVKLIKTGLLSYTLNDTISYPVGFVPGPGQLSKDGLSYYVSLDSASIIRFYKLTRPNSAAVFSNPTRLPHILYDTLFNIQPTVSGNETILAWTRNDNNMWDHNDLFMSCQNIQLGINDQTINSNAIQVFPNPNNGKFQLKLDKGIGSGEFVLFNALGERVFEKQMSAEENTIDTGHLSSGLYAYHFIQNKGGTYRGKLLIE